MKTQILNYGLSLLTAGAALLSVTSSVQAADKKPNILIIWGDDIGVWNVSAYNQGMMGYKTPNIDRIAKEGALFTDWYGQQSCAARKPDELYDIIEACSPGPHLELFARFPRPGWKQWATKTSKRTI